MRLAACSLSVCAASITNTRRAASNGVCAAAATTGRSMSATSISEAPDAVTHVRSGCDPRATRAATASGSLAPCASSAAANARAIERLPVPAGPWNRYACDGRTEPSSTGMSNARACGCASMPGSSAESWACVPAAGTRAS